MQRNATQHDRPHTLRFPCSLKAKAIPEYGKIPKSVGVMPLKRPTTPYIQKSEKGNCTVRLSRVQMQ